MADPGRKQNMRDAESIDAKTLKIGFAFLTAVLSVFVVMGCDVRVSNGNSNDPAQHEAMAESTKTHLYQIQWGYRQDDLMYVCFTGQRLPAGSVTGIVSSADSGLRRNYFVRRPDGTRQSVPGPYRLFELIDGHFVESTQRVTRACFEAFMRDRRETYSINALIRFAEEYDKTEVRLGHP